VGALLGVVLLGVGCLLAAGLTIEDSTAASLAVGLALAISVLELLTDAIPGIVLRLDTHLVTDHFAVPHASWAMSPLADQKLAGSILWGVAELLDMPFLFVMFLRWVRADEREARRVDHVPGPQPASAQVSSRSGSAPSAATDEPWWLHDPELSHRLGLTKNQPDDRGINPRGQQ
jgi:putative membrane protein